MWDLGNNLNWDRVLTKTYYAQPITADGKQFKPIPTITTLVNSTVLLIGCRNPRASETWYTAGFASARLLFSPSSRSEFTAAVQSYPRIRLGLDRLNLVAFKDFNLLPYLLEINISKWHKEMLIEVWQYSGETDNIQAQLNRIEAKISNEPKALLSNTSTQFDNPDSSSHLGII